MLNSLYGEVRASIDGARIDMKSEASRTLIVGLRILPLNDEKSLFGVWDPEYSLENKEDGGTRRSLALTRCRSGHDPTSSTVPPPDFSFAGGRMETVLFGYRAPALELLIARTLVRPRIDSGAPQDRNSFRALDAPAKVRFVPEKGNHLCTWIGRSNGRQNTSWTSRDFLMGH